MIHKYIIKAVLIIHSIFFGFICNGQVSNSLKKIPKVDSVSKEPKTTKVKYPQFIFKGLFQGRYVVSGTKNVDVNKLHHTDNKGSSNGFTLKYVRVSLKAKISPKAEVVTLVNLADFKNDTKTRVLENAYLRYTVSPKMAFSIGQFRPAFGLEDSYPVDIIKSIDWSNQYTEFGLLGWTSFQEGVAMDGNLSVGKMPLSYAFSITNGNGKNKINDDDSGKHYSTRFALGLDKKHGVNFGINLGAGEVQKKQIYGLGLDLTGNINITPKLNLDMQIEAKQATNHLLYFANTGEKRTHELSAYLIRGIYFLPNFTYKLDHKNLNALEFSFRYEYLDNNFRIDSNPRHSYTPMVGIDFLKDYDARLQVGMQLERYKKQIENTTQYNSNLFIVQLQARF